MDQSDFFLDLVARTIFFHFPPALVLVSNYTHYTFPSMTRALYLTYLQYYTELPRVTFKLTSIASALWVLMTWNFQRIFYATYSIWIYLNPYLQQSPKPVIDLSISPTYHEGSTGAADYITDMVIKIHVLRTIQLVPRWYFHFLSRFWGILWLWHPATISNFRDRSERRSPSYLPVRSVCRLTLLLGWSLNLEIVAGCHSRSVPHNRLKNENISEQ